MSTIQSSISFNTSTRLLDKYVLPKVALTVITVASFIGTWLTMSTHGAGTWFQVGTRWLHLIIFATLTGGYMWKGLYSYPAEKPGHQPYFIQFTAASFARFRRLAQIILPIFLLTAIYDLLRFTGWGIGLLIEAETVLLSIITLTIGVDAYSRRQENPFAERGLARFILLMLLLDALIQAGFDVMLSQGGGMCPWLVRWLHLAAFFLWFGGAVWNICITVPAARGIISLPVVVSASGQLERFRLVVRVLLPTIIVTGFIQAYRYVGFNLNALTSSFIGWLILTKILLIGVLIIVFLTCPMWRACSPISGMCKLDDLYIKEQK